MTSPSPHTKAPKAGYTPYWWKVLYQLAPKRVKLGRKPFTNTEVDKSCVWQTCACGKQDKRIPRDKWDKEPHDQKLATAGMDFMYALKLQDLPRAKIAMHYVELNAKRVLKQYLSEHAQAAVRPLKKG